MIPGAGISPVFSWIIIKIRIGNQKMKYEEFKEKLVDAVKEFYGEDVTVIVEKVLRNNNYSYDGLKIMKEPKDMVVPMIHLNHVYEKYRKEGMELKQCVESVCQLGDEEEQKQIISEFASKLTRWENIKEQVYPVLMLTKKNEELLKRLATTEFLDMSVIYRICKNIENDGMYSININRAMLKDYGITIRQLHEQAVKNLEKGNYQFISMDSYARALIQFMGLDEKTWMEDKEYTPMHILTNDSKIYGASGILDKELMKEFAGDKNYFVILSSMHEAILVPDNGEKDREELNKIIEDTYVNAVYEEDQLSSHFYYYHGTTGKISMDK